MDVDKTPGVLHEYRLPFVNSLLTYSFLGTLLCNELQFLLLCEYGGNFFTQSIAFHFANTNVA